MPYPFVYSFSFPLLAFLYALFIFFVFNKVESNPYVTIIVDPLLYPMGCIVSAFRAMLISMVGMGIHWLEPFKCMLFGLITCSQEVKCLQFFRFSDLLGMVLDL